MLTGNECIVPEPTCLFFLNFQDKFLFETNLIVNLFEINKIYVLPCIQSVPYKYKEFHDYFWAFD